MILVGPQVRHQSRLVRPTAKDRVVHLAPPALDASVAPDGVHLAAGFPHPCPEDGKAGCGRNLIVSFAPDRFSLSVTQRKDHGDILVEADRRVWFLDFVVG